MHWDHSWERSSNCIVRSSGERDNRLGHGSFNVFVLQVSAAMTLMFIANLKWRIPKKHP